MVEDVEGLPAFLNPITLFEREVLEVDMSQFLKPWSWKVLMIGFQK
jgi:hypothetical protein